LPFLLLRVHLLYRGRSYLPHGGTAFILPESVQRLQAALQAKAKGEPGFRFYALYDKVYRRDVLAHA